jgi:hypothetical protein
LAALVLSTSLFTAATLILLNAHAGLEMLIGASALTAAAGGLVFRSVTGRRGVGTFAVAFVVLLGATWLAGFGLAFLLFLVFDPSLFVF